MSFGCLSVLLFSCFWRPDFFFSRPMTSRKNWLELNSWTSTDIVWKKNSSSNFSNWFYESDFIKSVFFNNDHVHSPVRILIVAKSRRVRFFFFRNNKLFNFTLRIQWFIILFYCKVFINYKQLLLKNTFFFFLLRRIIEFISKRRTLVHDHHDF